MAQSEMDTTFFVESDDRHGTTGVTAQPDMNMQPATDPVFFVESDDGHHGRQLTIQQRAKLIARQKQDLIANELSRLAADEYLEDILQHMRRMEVRLRTVEFGNVFANWNIRMRRFPMSTSSTCSARSNGS